METQKLLANILKPLVVTGIYKDEKVALKDIVADYIVRKIEEYTNTIRSMEAKYGNEFSKITKDFKNKATMENEEDWMEWKAAIVMSQSWNQALKKLIRNVA